MNFIKIVDKVCMDHSMLKDFLTESNRIMDDFKNIMNRFEDQRDASLFIDLATIFDKLLGASVVFDLQVFIRITKLSKDICLKGRQIKDRDALMGVAGLIFQVLNNLTKTLDKLKMKDFDSLNDLHPLADKLEQANNRLEKLISNLHST